jgi:hypothetical protein
MWDFADPSIGTIHVEFVGGFLNCHGNGLHVQSRLGFRDGCRDVTLSTRHWF